jgi:bcr-type benzoyl-CoA reductase subunit C
VDLKELYERRNDIAREEKEKNGRPVLGTLCSYAPVEIIHSFGILPVRIWGQADDVQAADALMQPYICPPVRHLMALGIEGHYDFLDGIVHTYSCDATCGLYNIWVRNMRPAFSHLISLPYIDIPESREYAAAELGSFVAELESFTGRKFSPAELGRSLALYDETRSLIAEAYQLKGDGVPISYVDMHYMNLCLQVLPVETALPHLRVFLEAARGMEPRTDTGRRILISGSVIPDTALMAFIEKNGGAIVADDTCLGYRLVKDASRGEGAEGGDPLTALAGLYLERTPCASRADFPARKEYILEVLERFDIDAVIFVHQKYCDPHLSDHPFLKEVLAGAGVPSMQLELEGESFNSQIQTHIEGFFEMIGAK